MLYNLPLNQIRLGFVVVGLNERGQAEHIEKTCQSEIETPSLTHMCLYMGGEPIPLIMPRYWLQSPWDLCQYPLMSLNCLMPDDSCPVAFNKPITLDL